MPVIAPFCVAQKTAGNGSISPTKSMLAFAMTFTYK
jgi:hypothetical protein